MVSLAPAVKAEDPVGLRDGVPALEIGEFAAMGLTGADMASGWVGARSACSCFAEKPITVSSRSRPVRDWKGWLQATSAPPLRSWARTWRLSLGSPGSQ